MINELPMLEKLKIRYKRLYNKELNCIRCNRKCETLHHLWECDKETNNIIKFERIIKEWLRDRIHNMNIFKEVDNLLDDLYKYTRFSVTLRHLNTKENTEIYRRLNPFDKRLIYIWDETESMDDLIRGWVPNKLLNILKQKKIKGSIKDIEKLLSNWMLEIVKFIKELWQRRNDDLAKWEKLNNITKAEKRKVCKNKKSQNEQRKRKISGKRSNYYHFINDKIYERVKQTIGLIILNIDLGFHNSHDKRVGSFYFTVIINIKFVRKNFI